MNHNRFNSSQSSTFSDIGETYTLAYGFGDVSVVLGYDTVTVSDFRCVGALLPSGKEVTAVVIGPIRLKIRGWLKVSSYFGY